MVCGGLHRKLIELSMVPALKKCYESVSKFFTSPVALRCPLAPDSSKQALTEAVEERRRKGVPLECHITEAGKTLR